MKWKRKDGVRTREARSTELILWLHQAEQMRKETVVLLKRSLLAEKNREEERCPNCQRCYNNKMCLRGMTKEQKKKKMHSPH